MSVAVIGCGYWGKNLVRNFSQAGQLTLVCDATETGRAAARQLAPDAEVVDDIERVLVSDVQGVVIATPAETHHPLARRALLAGKDVFVEKPLALTFEDGLDLVQLAEREGRILMVGHLLEYHPAITELLRMVRQGELGEVRYVYSNRVSLGKVRQEENALWSLAPHDFAVILRLTDRLPTQVSASGGSYVTAGIDDVTVTHLRFEDGVRAHVFASWLHPFKEHRWVVVGERKMASYDDVTKKLVLYDHRIEMQGGHAVAVKGDGAEVAFADDEPLKLECEAFLHAIHTRAAPLTDGKSGLRVLRVLQAAQRSLDQGGQAVTFESKEAA